ncbi:MAG: 2-oxo acid dehydrogenase subunit E2 [Deltaproteobacteria bacterium]|nr:2-oxo acid dehydrogenase subunit E2 [Deltaproteobacteria bacterium]
MATKIMMPQAGQDITEGRIVKWLKAEGDAVKEGEPICEVETEKVVFEVESPADGILLKIVVSDGEKAEIFSTIGVVGATGETVDLKEFLKEEAAEEKGIDVSHIRKQLSKKREGGGGKLKISGRARKLAKKMGVDPETIEGSGPGGRIVEKDIMTAAESDTDTSVRISPVARKMAQEHRIDTRKLKGSGPGGRIVKEDVQQAIEGAPDKGAPLGKPAKTGSKKVGEIVPIRGVRQVIFERMHQSLQQSAQLTISSEVDAKELVRFRTFLGEGPEDERIKVSYNAILLKMLAKALETYPRMNASVVENEIWEWKTVNLGVAVDVEEGLVVPVIRDANLKSVVAIQNELNDLATRARSKKLVPDDLQGGTFTLTNLGFLDVDAFTPIINPPESGILGVGRIVEKPVVENGEITAGKRMVLSLTFDHRIIDGADGGRFLKKLKSYIENPYILMAVGS